MSDPGSLGIFSWIGEADAELIDDDDRSNAPSHSFFKDVERLLDQLPRPRSAIEPIAKLQRRVRHGLGKRFENMQQMRRRVMTGSPTQRVRDAVGKRFEETMETQVYPRVRKLVTGDADTSVEVHMSKPRVVKRTDRRLFTLSVLFVLFSEWVFVAYPHCMWLLYAVIFVPLALFRTHRYNAKKWGYFLYDFCYMFNLSLWVNLVFFPTNDRWLRANFVLATGPIAMSIVAWRNQMVFHSEDKMVSLFVHLFPSLVLFSLRWHPQTAAVFGSISPLCAVDSPRPFCAEAGVDAATAALTPARLGWLSGVVRPGYIYLLWQCLQIIKTEFIDGKYLREHPEVYTSLRWIAKDRRNGMNITTLKCMRLTRFMGRDEEHSPDSLKSKLAMWFFQAVFYAITGTLGFIAFHSFWFNSAYICTIVAIS